MTPRQTHVHVIVAQFRHFNTIQLRVGPIQVPGQPVHGDAFGRNQAGRHDRRNSLSGIIRLHNRLGCDVTPKEEPLVAVHVDADGSHAGSQQQLLAQLGGVGRDLHKTHAMGVNERPGRRLGFGFLGFPVGFFTDFAITRISRSTLTEMTIVEGHASREFVTEGRVISARSFDG